MFIRDINPTQILNSQDNDKKYIDPITLISINDEDEIIVLRSVETTSKFYIYLFTTIEVMILNGNVLDPITREPIDNKLIKNILIKPHPLLETLNLVKIGKLMNDLKENTDIDIKLEPKAFDSLIRRHLIIYVKFNNDISIYEYIDWPPNIETLVFDDEYNQSMENFEWFPQTLLRITFGNIFNQPIDTIKWATNLQSLKFGDNFNQPIECVYFPDSLLHITFGDNFNQPIEKVRWSKNLQSLVFGYDFNQPIEDVNWNDSLQILSFDFKFNQSLEKVKWSKNLQSLTLGFCFVQPLEKIILPSTLHILDLSYLFTGSLEHFKLPEQLHSLSFKYDSYTDEIIGSLYKNSIDRLIFPSNLKYLYFDEWFQHPPKHIQFPDSLEIIIFNDFNYSVKNVKWPSSLKRLTLGDYFNKPITKKVFFPPLLQYLTFGKHFKHSLKKAVFPDSLLELELSENYTKSMTKVKLPPSTEITRYSL
jgi:hypothetical protein